MELQLLHISNIIPPLYPIVLHPFIFSGYPTYRDKTRSYFVQSPLRGTSLSFPRGQVSSQGSTTLEIHKFFHRPYFSYPRKWSKSSFIESLLIKSKSLPMMLTLLILKFLQSPAFPLHASTQHLNIKEMFPLLLLFFFFQLNYPPSLWDNLWQSPLLHYSGNILLLTSLEVSL